MHASPPQVTDRWQRQVWRELQRHGLAELSYEGGEAVLGPGELSEAAAAAEEAEAGVRWEGVCAHGCLFE